MSTLYKSAPFALATTDNTTIYTCPAEVETIIKGIQITNHGAGNTAVECFIERNSTTYEIAHKLVSSNDTSNVLATTIILEAGDVLSLTAASGGVLSGVMPYLEIRSDTNNPI